MVSTEVALRTALVPGHSVCRACEAALRAWAGEIALQGWAGDVARRVQRRLGVHSRLLVYAEVLETCLTEHSTLCR